ncbi:hypothetical protein FOZ63_004558, partial [Perkinsus olseni]
MQSVTQFHAPGGENRSIVAVSVLRKNHATYCGFGGRDGGDDEDDRRHDGEKRNGLLSKWLLPTTNNRRTSSSGSEQSQNDDVGSVGTNATSAGTNDFDSVTEARNRSSLFVFDLDQTLVSSSRHGVV